MEVSIRTVCHLQCNDLNWGYEQAHFIFGWLTKSDPFVVNWTCNCLINVGWSQRRSCTVTPYNQSSELIGLFQLTSLSVTYALYNDAGVNSNV